MIKTALIFIAVSFMISSNLKSQDVDTSSVNIREILNRQISGLKENKLQENGLIPKAANHQAEILPASDSVLKNTIENTLNEYLSKNIAVKIFVTIEILLLTGLVVLWLTKNKRDKKRKIAALKKNIQILREERIGSLEKNDLSVLRGRLRFDPIRINDNGKDITFRARKNNIGKGEIHLAAKIKMMVGEYK